MASFLKCESCETVITLVNVIACEICKVSGCDECVKTMCQHCGIVMCKNCININDIKCDGVEKCKYCEMPNAPQESEKVEEVKTKLKCESCETEIELKDAIRCECCNLYEDDTESVDYDDDVSVDSWDGKKKHLFCKKCTEICDACKERGCKKCVTFACCDCGYDMCIECRNNEFDCGCYGECYRCYVNINRGSEGWPCSDCKMWYCDHCRSYDNPCKSCGPESESESESDNEEN